LITALYHNPKNTKQKGEFIDFLASQSYFLKIDMVQAPIYDILGAVIAEIISAPPTTTTSYIHNKTQ